MRSSSFLLAAALTLASVSSARQATADESADARVRAATSFHRGQTAYARHDYAEAGEAFDLAAGFDPNPVALLDAADAWALAGEPLRAAEDCDRALGMAQLTEQQRRFATKQLESLRLALAAIDVPAAAGVVVDIDGSAATASPVHRRVAPGRHRVHLRDATGAGGDRQDTQDISVRGGETVTVVPHLQPSAPFPPPVPVPAVAPAPVAGSSGRKPVPTATWIAFGAGAAALVPFAVFGVKTIDARSAYDTAAKTGTPSSSTFWRDAALTDVFLGLAAAGAVTGVLVWTLTPSATVTVGQRVSFEARF